MTKILIIEDNRQMREFIRSEICEFVSVIYESEDGAQVLPLYRRHQPAWVLMDLELKTVDGLTAIRRLKIEFPQAQICIVTNYDNSFMREEAQAAGACAFVPKADLSLLREVITHASV